MFALFEQIPALFLTRCRDQAQIANDEQLITDATTAKTRMERELVDLGNLRRTAPTCVIRAVLQGIFGNVSIGVGAAVRTAISVITPPWTTTPLTTGRRITSFTRVGRGAH